MTTSGTAHFEWEYQARLKHLERKGNSTSRKGKQGQFQHSNNPFSFPLKFPHRTADRHLMHAKALRNSRHRISAGEFQS